MCGRRITRSSFAAFSCSLPVCSLSVAPLKMADTPLRDPPAKSTELWVCPKPTNQTQLCATHIIAGWSYEYLKGCLFECWVEACLVECRDGLLE